MQRAAEARTSTNVSSISRMTMRIIFAGSSERSSISVMLAAKISRVREKILIQSLRMRKLRALNLPIAIQNPCQSCGKAEVQQNLPFSASESGENPCQLVGFATNSRSDFLSGDDGADRPIHWPEPRFSRCGRAGEPGRALEPAGAGDR